MSENGLATSMETLERGAAVAEEGFAIVTEELTRRYGRKLAVDRVSARVPKGSIYGLMGPNGAGKTTFIRCLLNLITPTAGRARVLGHDVVRESVQVRQPVGHVAALQALWEWMTVGQLAHLMAGCYPGWNQEAVVRILSRVGLEPGQRIGELSRGQRALASMAVAAGHQPELLLLDEALTGLDPISRREALRRVIEVMHEEGRTVLIAGQDIADMERVCDYVGFLVKGRLFWESPLEDLKARVKRLRVEHAEGAAPEVPDGALRVERARRVTEFTVTGFSPDLIARLPGGRSRWWS
mgnify:CR=1 FL=1